MSNEQIKTPKKNNNKVWYIICCWIPTVIFGVGVILTFVGLEQNQNIGWMERIGLIMCLGMAFTALIMFTRIWIKHIFDKK